MARPRKAFFPPDGKAVRLGRELKAQGILPPHCGAAPPVPGIQRCGRLMAGLAFPFSFWRQRVVFCPRELFLDAVLSACWRVLLRLQPRLLLNILSRSIPFLLRPSDSFSITERRKQWADVPRFLAFPSYFMSVSLTLENSTA